MCTCYVVRNRIIGFSVSVLPGQPSRAWTETEACFCRRQRNKESGEALSEPEEAQWMVYSEMGDWSVLTWTCSLLVLWNYLAAGYLKSLTLHSPTSNLQRARCIDIPTAVLVSEWHTNCSLKCSTVLRGTCLHFQSCSWLLGIDVSQC